MYAYSSNWKELKTLLLTLQNLCHVALDDVRGTTILFYFTDNSATYWIASLGSSPSPGLHALIEEIRLMELELGCCLQVVHVPGVIMIRQGTDGLSRGVWATALHDLEEPGQLNTAVFEPLIPDSQLVDALAPTLGQSTWRLQPWDAVWKTQDLFDQLTVWFPSS